VKDLTRHRLRSLASRSIWQLQELATAPTWRWRMLPSYLIVGGQRCGTTSLQKLLAGHPQIRKPTFRKGIHYFDTDYAKSPAWYQAHFPWDFNKSKAITGEGSPYYLFHPAVPGRIHHLLPDVKIIALLRDPVERAISHHKHEVRRGFESLDLEQALAAEDKRLAGEAEKLMSDPEYLSFNHQHFSYVARGQYADQVQRYLDLFGPEKVFVAESESLWSSPEPILKEVLGFLGLDDWAPAEFPHMNATRPSEIGPQIHDYLAGQFSASNARLEGLLGRTFSWS
jgi:hypothetical protein